MVREELNPWSDEVLFRDLAITFIMSLSLTVTMVIPNAFLHEALHYLGALLEGGVVKEVVWFNAENWFSTYIHPITASSGGIGSVTASLPKNPRFGKLMFFFLPYIVLFPVSFFLMLGDNTRFLFGGDGISNVWRIVGGPLFVMNFAAFWTDYSLFVGVEQTIVPFPAIFYQFLYLGVIVTGVVGSTVYLQLVKN